MQGQRINQVSRVHWRLNGASNSVSDSIYGEAILEYDEKNQYINYENLSEDIVIDWVKKYLGDKKTLEYEEVLTNKINNLISPDVVPTKLPW